MSDIAPLSIRRAVPGDLDALVALETRVFDYDRMSRAQFRRHLGSGTALVLVAIGGNRLFGAATIFFRTDATYARLYSLAIASEARGRGIGSVLLDAVEAAARDRGARRLGLEVRTDNSAAIALYEARGYRRSGRREAYYDDGADAYRYLKNLSPGRGVRKRGRTLTTRKTITSGR